MNKDIRDQFAAAREYSYLNSAAVAPLPQNAIKAINIQLNDVAGHGSSHYTDWVATKDRCRTALASMIGARNDEVAFTRNTSDGFASIAAGIDWRAGDNIVSFENEFPANFYAWRSARDSAGVEIRLAPERDGRIDLDELIAMIDARTRVVALSSVQFSSGFRADLERVGKAARAVDALFCVDLIQGLGAHGYDLAAMNVDAACGASHKWLCGPEGIGYIYLSQRARDRIRPTLVGWISVEDPWDFTDREQPFKNNALAWESGTGTSSLFYGLEQSLNLLNGASLDTIASYLDELSTDICRRVEEKGYEVVSSRAAGERSAIVCVRHTGGMSPNEIAKRLAASAVIVSPRIDRLRIAPHFFNNSADVDRLIDSLP